MYGIKQEQFMNKNIRQKSILSAALLVAATASAFAQGNGIAGINEATSMVSSYFDPGTKLIYAIGAVVGLIGGVKVYGLLALFILFVILYMVGIDQWVCIGFGASSSSVLVWQTFALNARYGEHGLMKLGAARSHPRYLINRRRITRLFKRQRKEETT